MIAVRGLEFSTDALYVLKHGRLDGQVSLDLMTSCASPSGQEKPDDLTLITRALF
jgi:hypothetical protein